MQTPIATTPAASPTLRSATPSDLPAIEALLTRNQLPIDGVREIVDSFSVAESEGEIVGVAALERCGDHALLRSVAVDDAWRSRGVARELVLRVIGEAELHGLPAMYLLTMSAEEYFPRFGFQKVARENVPDDIRANPQFTTMCPSSAVVMRRPLSAPASEA